MAEIYARKVEAACWFFEALEEPRSVNYLYKLLGTKEDLVPPRLHSSGAV